MLPRWQQGSGVPCRCSKGPVVAGGSSQPECGTAVAAQRMLQPVLKAKGADRQARRMWTHGLSPAGGVQLLADRQHLT